MKSLEKVYNRGFWSGYYLGQKLGEWSDVSGSKATQKKVYVGKGVHYFPKTGIAEFKIEAYEIKIGDKLLITGPTTGVEEFELTEMMVKDEQHDIAKKGDSCTLRTDFRVRMSDKLYKLVQA
jgi:putative protease